MGEYIFKIKTVHLAAGSDEEALYGRNVEFLLVNGAKITGKLEKISCVYHQFEGTDEGIIDEKVVNTYLVKVGSAEVLVMQKHVMTFTVLN